MSDKSKIGAFAKVRRGASPRPIGNPKYFGGKVGWIRISDVTASRKYLRKTEQYVSSLGESLSVHVDKGDLIMSICGTIGRPIIIDFPSCIHDGFVQLYDIKNADIEYLYYILQYHEKDLEGKGQPGTQVNLNTGIVESFEVYYPSLSHQLKIAQILSTTDAVIEKTQAAISKYKAIKQGMLHDLFTRGIDIDTGKLRPKYEDAPELYKESKLGLIPKEWKVEMIGDMSSLVTNGFVGVATPYYTTADNGVPYFFGTNIRADSIEFNDLRYISREFNSSHVKSQLKPGDMLCVQSGHIGTCAVVPIIFFESNCHALIITRFYKEMIYPEFISFYLNSSIGKHHLDKIIIGSTIKHINTSDLAKHLIPIPTINEQRESSKRLTVIDHKLQTEQIYLQKLQSIKQGLMGDLLSGRRSVNADSAVNEPADFITNNVII